MAGDPAVLSLSLLVLGHVLADFVLQNDRMVARKAGGETMAFLLHGAIVLGVAIAAYAPLLTPLGAFVLLGVAGSHILIDLGKTLAARRRRNHSLRWFFLDQGAHFVVLLVAWKVLLAPGYSQTTRDWLPEWLPTAAFVAAGLAFAHTGGNAIVRMVLEKFPAIQAPAGRDAGMGKLIGTLERWIAILLILVNQWAALGFLVAAKSLARLPEMRDPDDRSFAQYYLIGTLTSLLVALATGLGLSLLVGG